MNVEDEQKQVATEKTNTREMVKQLDVLLLQVAQASTKGIDAKALKGKVSDLGLSKNELSALNTLIDQAANSLKALDKFTGRELVFATTRDNKLAYVWDTNDAAGKTIKTALDAQAALSEKLFELISTREIPREAKAALESAALACDCRACEIGTLVMQFSLAVTKMVHGNIETLDKEVRDRLDTKLFALMGEKAITMTPSRARPTATTPTSWSTSARKARWSSRASTTTSATLPSESA